VSAKIEKRCQISDDRGQKSDDRCQISDDRGQKSRLNHIFLKKNVDFLASSTKNDYFCGRKIY
jgi:hypothetical protein